MKISDKIITYYAMAGIMVIATVSCHEEVPEYTAGQEVECGIRILIDDGRTQDGSPSEKADVTSCRSLAGPEEELDSFESEAGELCFFSFCHDGRGILRLDSSGYFNLREGENPVIRGVSGRKYVIYSLINCGDRSDAVAKGEDTGDIEMLCHSPASAARPDPESGIPMFCGPVEVMFSPGRDISLNFTRMAARFDFQLQSGLEHGDFTAEQLVLRQSPAVAYPFSGSRYCLKEEDGEYARDGDMTGPHDLERLQNGEKVRFYSFENACGRLLDNPLRDPSQKIPESGTSIGGYLPTYLELTGTYTDKSGELLSHNTYRMYLGRNNYDDFDVLAGTRYRLTLTLSDESGFLESWWKLDAEVSDSRQFHFVTHEYQLEAGSGRLVKVSGDRPEYGISYTLEGGLAGVSFYPSTMMLNNGRNLSRREGRLVARYWDGRIADSCRIVALAYKAPADVSPIGIEEIHTEWDSSNFGYIHDPDCPIDHGAHDPRCHDNHIAPWEDDYVDIDDCPHRIIPESECKNRILVPTGAGIVDISFCIACDYGVGGDGKLTYRKLVPGVDYELVAAYLQDLNGNDFEDDIQYTEPEYDGTAVSLSAQFQDSRRTHWHIHIQPLKEGLDNIGREYIVSSGGDSQLLFPYCSLDLSPTVEPAIHYPVCSADGKRIWFISDTTVVKFANTDTPSRKNSFMDGEEMMSSVQSGKGGRVTDVYALDMNGAVIGALPFNTDEYSCDILSHAHVTVPFPMSELKFYFYTGFKSCTLPADVYDAYLAARQNGREQLFTVRGNELGLSITDNTVSISLMDQTEFDSYHWDIEVILDWSDSQHLIVDTDGSWSLR